MMILARLLFAVGTIFYCFSRIKFTPEGPEFEFRGIATVVGGRRQAPRWRTPPIFGEGYLDFIDFGRFS